MNSDIIVVILASRLPRRPPQGTQTIKSQPVSPYLTYCVSRNLAIR